MGSYFAVEGFKAQESGCSLMSEWEHLIPRPTSRFLRVRCITCESEQIIFSHASSTVECLTCGEKLAEPTGGKAKINGAIVAVLG